MIKQEFLLPELNVRVSLHDAAGTELEVREGHNILTNTGRTWCRDRALAITFPADSTSGVSGDYAKSNHVARYIGVGSGGQYAVAAPNSQTEIVTINGLEAPLLATDTAYLRDIAAPGSTTPSETLPDGYTGRCIRVFGFDEISNVGDPDQGPTVQVSEAGLFITSADPTAEPLTSSAEGMVAYYVFEPISKTGANLLKVVWELRY